MVSRRCRTLYVVEFVLVCNGLNESFEIDYYSNNEVKETKFVMTNLWERYARVYTIRHVPSG